MEVGTPPQPSVEAKKSEKKIFSIGGGQHSRTSSCNSTADDLVELLPSSMKAPLPGEVKGEEGYSAASSSSDAIPDKDDEVPSSCRARWCTVSGSCMCKLSIVFYLAACILVSALYVAFYGKNQAFFGDAWIPGKPTVHDKPSPSPPHYFDDLEYTEWISQRWTLDKFPFADWPTLPAEIEDVRQLVSGKLGSSGGLWMLTDQQLYFVYNLHRGTPENVWFVNISQELDLEVTGDSYIAAKYGYSLYLVNSYNASYLDCSQAKCEVVASACEDFPFEKVYSSCYSLSDSTLWLGTSHGLFTVLQQGSCLAFENITHVTEPVRTLAWRSVVASGEKSRNPTLRSFFFKASVQNHLQEVFASSGDHGTQWTGRFWSDRKVDHGFGVLVVGTADKVYFHDGKQWWHEFVSQWRHGWGGLIDGAPTAMTFGPSGELYVANNVSLTRVNVNYTFDRIGPLEGLPYNQLTSLFVSPHTPQDPPLKGPALPPSVVGTLWIGTTRGYALYDIERSKFVGYFGGPRWLPEGAVRNMVGCGSAAIVLTDTGLALVRPELWTLSSKAHHYQRMLERHTREPGLVADCALANYAASTCRVGSTDGDSLSTSWMVAAEAFRYKVTSDTGARSNAWRFFNGLKFLVNVTGVDGMLARSVLPESNATAMGGGARWHESSSIPGWRWKGDARSDSVLGHMLAYPLMHDLVVEGEEQQQGVAQLLENIIDPIRSNDYMLAGMGNHSSRLGVWSPSQLNSNHSRAAERGVNSLQILAYLLSAYRITNDNKYLHAWKELISDADYGRNIVNQKMTFPLHDFFRDDELSFLPYFLYYYSIKKMDKHQVEEVGPEAQELADLSLERAWRTVSRGKSSAWAAMYAYITGAVHDEGLMEELVWTLRKWPLELIDWPTTNSHRLDITVNPETHRHTGGGGLQSVEVLPPNERSQLHWSGNPFQLDSPGASREVDPGPWLLPYWLARWTDIIH